MEYVIRRVLATLPVMLVVSLIVFMLIHLAPGDPVLLIVGDFATPEQISQTRAALGLDQPLWHQFGVWSGNVLRGDLGVSLFNQMPVTQLLGQRVGATLSIAFFTILL
ncbi:MAG: dppB, partial [Rhizobacter sp.]|nr:dppB [Rhizobacter sp.]